MDEFEGLIMLVAQKGVTGFPGDGGSAPGPAADGATTGGGGGGASPFGGMGFYLILFGFIAIFLIMSLRGQSREKRKREDLLKSLKKHDRVQTVGGVIGSIVEIKPDTVVLKVDESANTRITFARSSIQQVISSRENGKDDKDAED